MIGSGLEEAKLDCPDPQKGRKSKEEKGLGGEDKDSTPLTESRRCDILSHVVLEFGSGDNTYPGDQACQRQADSWRGSAEPCFAALALSE
jgi:hypothetical protein